MFKSIKKIFTLPSKKKKDSDNFIKIEKWSHQDSPAKRMSKQWIGVDLDGTLAYYGSTSTIKSIGRPIPDMRDLVLKMIRNGIRIKVFTARVQYPGQIEMIENWLKKNGFPPLEITNVKDFNMKRLYDDRCIQVERNTGRLIV